MTRRPHLDWDHVRVFLAVARAGGQARAAALLQLSEATVGRHLAALEAVLGAPLFDRLPNRLALTPLGTQLLGPAAAMEEHAAGLGRLALAAQAQPARPIRLTATTSVALFVTRHLDRLRAAAASPLEVINTRAALSLARRDAEMALRMRRPPAQGDLTVRRIGRLAVALYAHRTLVGEVDERSAGELGRLTFIGLRDDPDSRQSAWLDRLAAGASVPVRLGDLALRLEAARQGHGATLLPCFLGDHDSALARLLPPPPELAEDVYLLIHADLKNLTSIRTLADALVELFRSEAVTLAGGGQGS